MLAPNPEFAVDLVAEAHHRVANSLTLLVGMVRMQAQALGKSAKPLGAAEARLLLEGVAARIATVSQLHRLLAHVPTDTEAVDFDAHLGEVCRTLVEIASSQERPIFLEHSAQGCRIATHQVQPLTLVLCEIIINALKYAHPTGLPVHLTISCHHDAEGGLVIEAGDDGIGLPEHFDIAHDGGLGFRVIRSLSSQLGAHLKIDSSEMGLRFRIRLPHRQAA